jgi:hypothetical protein
VIVGRDSRDIAAGLVFAGIGGVVYALALDYPFGRTARLGPGYFPQIVSLALVALGLLIALRGALRRVVDAAPVPWRDLAIAGATIAAPVILVLAFATTPRTGLVLGVGAAAALAWALGRREFALVLAPLALLAIGLETIGLFLGAAMLVGVAGFAAHDSRAKEIAALAIGLAVFACAVFAWGIGVPLPVWPKL